MYLIENIPHLSKIHLEHKYAHSEQLSTLDNIYESEDTCILKLVPLQGEIDWWEANLYESKEEIYMVVLAQGCENTRTNRIKSTPIALQNWERELTACTSHAN